MPPDEVLSHFLIAGFRNPVSTKPGQAHCCSTSETISPNPAKVRVESLNDCGTKQPETAGLPPCAEKVSSRDEPRSHVNSAQATLYAAFAISLFHESEQVLPFAQDDWEDLRVLRASA